MFLPNNFDKTNKTDYYHKTLATVLYKTTSLSSLVLIIV